MVCCSRRFRTLPLWPPAQVSPGGGGIDFEGRSWKLQETAILKKEPLYNPKTMINFSINFDAGVVKRLATDYLVKPAFHL
jgi:hypothetical protein